MSVDQIRAESSALLRRIFLNNDSAWPAGSELSQDDFFQDVTGQGMAALLYRQLTAGRVDPSFPAELLSRLRSYTMHHAALEVFLEMDLRKVLDGMAGIGVRPLLIKGTPLAQTLYPAPGMRPRCDTDMLIADAERSRVAELLRQMDYTPLHEADADCISSQISFSRQDSRGHTCSYDIHWQLSNNNLAFSQAFADERLFARAVKVPELGEHARTLCHLDALIYACFHRAGHFSHSGDRLIWLYDIHLLCQALNEEEQHAFCDRARELTIVTLCSDAISTSRSWFGTVLPPVLESLLAEDAGQESSARYLQAGRKDGIRNHAVLQLQGMSGWRERCRFLWQNAFPPVQYMLWRYNTEQKRILPWLYLKRLWEGVTIFLRR